MQTDELVMHILFSDRRACLVTLSYSASKTGEFCFEAVFAVTIISAADADLGILGIVYFFRYLPSLLCSPIAGWVADNCNKKRTLLVVELLKSATLFLMFIAISQPTPSLWIITTVAMLLTALDCIYAPLFRVLSTASVKRGEFESLNSGLQVIEDSAAISGPLIFSLLASTMFDGASLIASAACFAVSAFSLAFLQSTKVDVRTQSFNWTDLISDSVKLLTQMPSSNRALFKVIACTSLCAVFATALIRFILPTTVLSHFESEAAVGYIMSLLALATVLGGFLNPYINKSTSPLHVYRYWTLYAGFFIVTSVSLSISDWLFFVLIFCTGFVGAFVDIAIITNIHLLSDQKNIGKNFSIYFFSAVTGDALSGAIAYIIVLIAGPFTFAVTASCLLVAAMSWCIKKEY